MHLKEKNYSRWLKILRIMKLFVFALFVFTVHASASVLAQNVTLKVENATVQQALTQLSRQTGVSIVYNESYFEGADRVNIDVNDVTLDEVLSICLGETGYGFRVDENVVYINKVPSQKQSPQKLVPVKGTVTDEDGEPVPSVTVMVKGTTLGTITDSNGRFQIDVPVDHVLAFSFVGMQKQEVTITDKPIELLTITMKPNISELAEVTISTGYQKIRPEQSTGSIASIGLQDLNSTVNTDNVLDALENKIPGLLLNNDIQFEGNNLFQIRGISTINGNKSPLVVIDGFPTELSLESINPNEIESITVLKDAAAAAIYGVRASNGVIIIERKEAQAGKLNVNFRSTFSLTPKTDYERFRWDDDVSSGMVDYMIERNQASASILYMYMTMPALGVMFTYPQPVIVLAEQAAGIITQEEADARYAALRSYNNTHDYQDQFLQNQTKQTYNLDISGGNKRTLYYLTVNYNTTDNENITAGGEDFRMSGRTNFTFNKWLRLKLNTDLQITKSHSSPIPDIANVYPFEHFQDENGDPAWIFSGSGINPYYNDYLMQNGLMDNMYYPLVDMNDIDNTSNNIFNRINATLLLDLGKGFNLSMGGIYEANSKETRHIAGDNSSEVKKLVNLYTVNGNSGLEYKLPRGSYLQQNKSRGYAYTLRAQLNYNKMLAEEHALNVILGGEMRDNVNKGGNAAYFGYNDQTLLQQPVDYATITGSYVSPYYLHNVNGRLSYNSLFGLSYNEDRFVSVYSSLVYSFKRRYSLTGSLRIDQSNLFGTDPKYRYKPLWSVGAAWVASDESFMEDFNWLENLKFRAALGFNGNVAKNSLPQIIASDGYNTHYSEQQRLSLSSPANSKLRWEQTYNMNLGLDYNIFKSVSGAVDYYVKKSTDVLARDEIDPTRGVSSAIVNRSSLRNSGLELTLHADWITRQHFNWNTGLVFSHNTSKILEVYNNEVTPESESYKYINWNTNYLEGYAIGAIFNYRYAGIDPEDGRTLIAGKDGSLKHFDEDNEGKDDVIYRGTSIPAYNVGLSNRFDIGNFYCYFMLNYYGGFKAKIPIPNPGVARPLEGAYAYWKEPGDELNPDMLPNITELTSGYRSYVAALDRYTINGAYITLGNVVASYSFRDAKFLRKLRIADLELKAQGSKLFTYAFNKQNYSKAMGSYEKNYITPTYTFALDIRF